MNGKRMYKEVIYKVSIGIMTESISLESTANNWKKNNFVIRK